MKGSVRQMSFMGNCVQGEGEVNPAQMPVKWAVNSGQGRSLLLTVIMLSVLLAVQYFMLDLRQWLTKYGSFI